VALDVALPRGRAGRPGGIADSIAGAHNVPEEQRELHDAQHEQEERRQHEDELDKCHTSRVAKTL
jgi:hypothetical protein